MLCLYQIKADIEMKTKNMNKSILPGLESRKRKRLVNHLGKQTLGL